MNVAVQHRLPGRLRLQAPFYAFDREQAIALEVKLEEQAGIHRARVNPSSYRILVEYEAPMTEAHLVAFLNQLEVAELVLPSSAEPRLANLQLKRELYWDLFRRTAIRFAVRLLPLPFLRFPITLWRARPYLKEGWASLKAGKLDVSLLDATAIALPILMGRPGEASNIMFLLGISESLEAYTVKRARNDLADSMAWSVDQVWLVDEAAEDSAQAVRQVAAASVAIGQVVRVTTGGMIPFDGEVVTGQALVNQASLTGEAEPLFRQPGHQVMAGTTVTEGSLDIRVQKSIGESRIHRIVQLLEQAENRKAKLQYKAEVLADRLVPMSFLLAGLVLLLTRRMNRVAAVLSVDYSCALKLALPIAVLSAMQSGASRQIAIRGGDHLEAYGEADTLVFDKTGTLTTAEPKLQKVIPLQGYTREQILKMAACIEEHFPHSLALAIVQAAKEEGLSHAEVHSKVRYIVAHGVVTEYEGEDARIGSYHFIFEDSGVPLDPDLKAELEAACGGYSTLYLAYRNELIGVLCVDEPIRPEAKQVLAQLRAQGFTRQILMTGDGARAAERVAQALGMDGFYAECLPEDKVKYIEQLQAAGARVVMVGDGVNDSPALAQADVSVAMRDASDLARETAHISLMSSDLQALVELRQLSVDLLARAHRSYRFILGFNSLLLGAGALALASASTLALLHNTSTLAMCLLNLLPYKKLNLPVARPARGSSQPPEPIEELKLASA